MEEEDSPYLTVRQVAQRLHLNEKKIYALVQEGRIPATRATGKWLFPRRLLDEWIVETSHGGALADRLVICGSDDPLLAYAVVMMASELADEGLVLYSPAGTREGLAQLARRRASLAAIHWGPAEHAARVHARLVAEYRGSEEWVIVQMALREQGILLGAQVRGERSLDALLVGDRRWILRHGGAGSQHFLAGRLGPRLPKAAAVAHSERHAAFLVREGIGDCAPGVRSAAGEFGLDFLPLGEEAFDFVLPRPLYFRALFQRLLRQFASPPVQELARRLGGYDLSVAGTLRVAD